MVAFGGRTPVDDRGTFFQLPAFHYLTGFDEPDAALVMVVRGRPRRPDAVPGAHRPAPGVLLRTTPRLGRIPGAISASAGRSVAALPWRPRLPRGRRAAVLHAGGLRGCRLRARRLPHPGRAFMRRFVGAASDRRRCATRIPIVDRAASAEEPRGDRAAEEGGARSARRGTARRCWCRDPRHEYELRAALECTFTATRRGAARLRLHRRGGRERHAAPLHEGHRPRRGRASWWSWMRPPSTGATRRTSPGRSP